MTPIEIERREIVARAICKYRCGKWGKSSHMQRHYIGSAQAALTALQEAGYVIVPREPTAEMLRAAVAVVPTWSDEENRAKYKAMIEAAMIGEEG